MTLTTKDNQKYMKEYFERPEVKERYNGYHRDWMRNKRHPPENKIKDIQSYIANIKKYPVDFPKEEFGNKLDKIIQYNPSEIKEKTLKDIIHDILDRKGILTPNRMIRIYQNSDWANAIEKFMNVRNYSRNGEETYTPIQK